LHHKHTERRLRLAEDAIRYKRSKGKNKKLGRRDKRED